MLASIKKIFKWNSKKSADPRQLQTSLLLAAFVGILEEVLFWKSLWLSLSFILCVNIIMMVCVHQQINLSGFVLVLSITLLCVDALENWLKYKHRTTCLKRLASYEGEKLTTSINCFNVWAQRKWNDFLYLRETNHTKAFLLVNINLIIVLIIGKYFNGYALTYLFLMFICVFYKVFLPVLRLFKSIKQDLESDCELEGLIPDVTEVDIKLLSIEPELNRGAEERHYDYWQPEDIPLGECSDSSDNSSSLVTNFSMEKMQTLEKDVETSDTSEDEYIPLDQQKDQLQSTLQVVQPSGSWSNSAYNAFWNLTGAVADMVQKETTDNKRKRLLSMDSSDGFEMIDKNDLS